MGHPLIQTISTGLSASLRKRNGSVAMHFDRSGLEVTTCVICWVFTLFSSGFPLNVTLRIWDCLALALARPSAGPGPRGGAEKEHFARLTLENACLAVLRLNRDKLLKTNQQSFANFARTAGSEFAGHMERRLIMELASLDGTVLKRRASVSATAALAASASSGTSPVIDHAAAMALAVASIPETSGGGGGANSRRTSGSGERRNSLGASRGSLISLSEDGLSPDGQLSPPASGGVERRFQSMSVSQADMQRGRSNSGGATAPWMIPGQQPGGMRGSLGQPGAGSIHGYGVSASPPGQSMYGQSGAAAAAQKKSFWSKAKSAKLGRASMSVIPDRRSIYDE